jgi:hypothetical protein
MTFGIMRNIPGYSSGSVNYKMVVGGLKLIFPGMKCSWPFVSPPTAISIEQKNMEKPEVPCWLVSLTSPVTWMRHRRHFNSAYTGNR